MAQSIAVGTHRSQAPWPISLQFLSRNCHPGAPTLSGPKDLRVERCPAEILRPSRRAQNDGQGNQGANLERQSLAVALLLAAALLCSFEAAGAEREAVRAERYHVDVAFQPEKGFLRAQATVTLRPMQNLSAIEFELNPHLKLLEVTDAQGRQLAFDRSQRMGSPKLSVRLAEPRAAGQEVALTFTYEGVLPARALDYITKDGILLRDESRWYPAVDLAAFTQNEINISVPSSWRAITSGQPQSSIGAGLASGYSWKTLRPVSSRSIAAFPDQPESCVPPPVAHGGFSKVEPLSACYIGQHQDSGKRLAEKAHELLKRYTAALGTYPQSVLIVVEGFPGQGGALGYSAPGFLVVSEDAVKFGAYPGYAPEFLPHEIAHQWFPIEVTLSSQEDGWLAESLAEYLAWRSLAETEPEPARLMVARAMRDALAPEPLRPLNLGLKLFATEDWDVTHATLYQRGMLVFRTLETVIDRERVDRALREFYARKAGTAASIADFRKTCEEVSGRDLGWFFEYFLDGTHIPEIELRRTPSAAPGEVAGEIVVRNTPPKFSVRVELRTQTTGGAINHSVATRGEVTPFTVTTESRVTGVTLDPDLRILRWTEATRRNRSQRPLLARAGALERAGEFRRAFQTCLQAPALDFNNLASNEQLIRFTLGRLSYRRGRLETAFAEFQRALEVSSLDPMESDFYRVWSRVYRAQIERIRGHLAAARAEAEAGLKIDSPALDTVVTWPGSRDLPQSARDALRAFIPSERP